METSKNERECEKPASSPMKPDPLSERPAPRPGQKWSFSEMQRTALKTFEGVENGDVCYHTADASEDWFRVLLGNYPPDPKSGSGKCVIPALANLGLYFWYIPPWYDDDQAAHKEDEAYFVVDGRGQLCVSGKKQKVAKGDLVFVPRSAPHRFFTPHGEGLTLLIIFSPVYSGGVHPAPPDEKCGVHHAQSDEKCKDWDDGRCRDKDYQERSNAYVERLVEKYKDKK